MARGPWLRWLLLTAALAAIAVPLDLAPQLWVSKAYRYYTSPHCPLSQAMRQPCRAVERVNVLKGEMASVRFSDGSQEPVYRITLDLPAPASSSEIALSDLAQAGVPGGQVSATVYDGHTTEIEGKSWSLVTRDYWNRHDEVGPALLYPIALVFTLGLFVPSLILAVELKLARWRRLQAGTPPVAVTGSSPLISVRGWALVPVTTEQGERLGLEGLHSNPQVNLVGRFEAQAACGEEHEPPAPDCRCGLYSADRLEYLCSYGVHLKPCAHCVVGLVSNTGRVLRYQRVLRSSHQRLLALVDRSTLEKEDRYARRVAEELGVPLVWPDGLNQLASEFGDSFLAA